MNLRAIGLFALLGFAAQVSCQTTPPNPTEIVTKLIMAYAKYENGGRDNTVIDMQGTTDWYQQNFIQYPPLKLNYFLTRPNIISSSRDAKDARMSTLMCPWTDFRYDCQLDSAVIRGSALATSKSTSWSVGATTKQTWMYGVEFLGNDGKLGGTFSFSFNWAGKDDETTATTEQSTTTGTSSLTIPANGSDCYELKSSLKKYAQRGESQMQAVFTEWVGFHDHPAVNWKDNNEPHYYRLRHISDIVSTAKAANLPDAAGWESFYDGVWKAKYSNTIGFDFFLGSNGANTQNSYDKNGTECASMMPKDWNTWLPTDGSGTGRRLLSSAATETPNAPSLTLKLLPETAKFTSQDASGMAKPLKLGFGGQAPSRKLLEEPSLETNSKKPTAPECPLQVHVHKLTDIIKTSRDPRCFGKGLLAHQKKLDRARRTKEWQENICALTAVLPRSPHYNRTDLVKLPYGLQGNHKLDVERKGRACRHKPTSRQELDARDAAKKAQLAAAQAAGGVTPALGEPQDFISKLTTLTRSLCFYESGADCSLDTDGTTSWYKQDFASHPSIHGIVGADDITMNPATQFSAATSSFFCQYNPNTNMICQASSADMRSSANVQSHTSSWTFSFKGGVKLKAKASFFGIGPSAEYETENTLDVVHSFSTGESKTTTDGVSTTATVKIPLTPDMNKCARISIITRKASAKGASRAWVCADGWVGTHQDPPKNWKDVDQAGETHYFRAWHIASIISTAQSKNLQAGGAFDWFIDGQGRGCLSNALDFDIKQGVMSFVKPELFDKDSPQCTGGQPATASHPATVTQAKTTEDSDWLVVQATPIPTPTGSTAG